MSETTIRPATRPRANAVTEWQDDMKLAFGFGASAPTSASHPLSSDRLATLRKTYDNVRGQAPDVAMRPLQDIASALAVDETLAADANQRLPAATVTFKKDVMAAMEDCKARAIATSQAHTREWRKAIDDLPPAGDTPKAREARALAIQKLVASVDAGIARDRYMLNRVDPKAAKGAMDAIDDLKVEADILKFEYAELRPQPKVKTGPVRLAEVARPQIGGSLTVQDQAELAALMKSTQGTMGADGKADPEKLDQAVALIAKGIDVEGAKATMNRLTTWDAVKKEYRDMLAGGRVDEAKDFMARMWWFRRMTVDGVMAGLQRQYDFTWGSVGSDNPESDYDLTVRTHPGKPTDEARWDYQIVEIANKALTKPFGGGPPGIVFDTNLYAEAAAAPQALTDAQQKDPAVKAMGAMKEQGQDVGALMKLRRFMEWDEYEDYKAAMLRGIPDPKDKALVLRQFEEADALFLIARAEQLQQAAAQMPDGDAKIRRQAEISGLATSAEGQRKLLEMAEELEHHPADSMAANNAIYVKKLTEVRELEAKYDGEADPVLKAGLLSRLKSLQADATFFAAEAYHSEGPLQHVVKAGQSSKLEIQGNGVTYPDDKAKDAAIAELKGRKLAMLSANQMLQSFNENLGDLLKDLRHYAAEPFPGLGFYRASKYIERLCDAAAIIAAKLPDGARIQFIAIRFGGEDPAVVQKAVANLVDIRGEKTGFASADGIDPEAEKQAYAIAQMTAIWPQIVTLPDLAKVAGAFGQRVNAVVRSVITAEMRATESGPYFPQNGKA